MALETLVILAGMADLSSVMTGIQLYIFAIVSVLFVPCISTIAVLQKDRDKDRCDGLILHAWTRCFYRSTYKSSHKMMVEEWHL